jgi:hypothetical protein
MRRRLQLSTLAVGLMLAASMLAGAGVSAVFRDRVEARQTIVVGGMELELASDTEGASIDGDVLACPAAEPASSEAGWSDRSCHIQIRSVGEIEPREITLAARAEGDPTGFNIRVQWGSGTWTGRDGEMSLDAAVGPLGTAVGPEADARIWLGWDELGQDDMYTAVAVSFTVDAVA